MTVESIRLIHTNDLHSHLDRWPHMATVINQERERAAAERRPFLYVDAGDHLDMSERISYGTTGEVNQRLLAAAGCAAFTIGNNEYLRLRLKDLCHRAEASQFPWLGANMRDDAGQPLLGIADWTVQEIGPVRVGLFGLQPLGMGWSYQGIHAADPDQTIQRCVLSLRAAGAHLVILLSHLGLEGDRQVALTHEGVDLIIGAHTHQVLQEPVVTAGVPLVQAGSFGRWVGVLDLTVDLDQTRLVSCTGRLVPVNPAITPADPKAVRIIAEATARANATLSEVVATLPRPLPHDPVGHSELAPLIAEALRRRAGAEVGLVPGGQAMHGFAAGPLTRSVLLDSLSPLFIPARLAYTGRHLAAVLEQAEDPAVAGRLLYAFGMRPRARPIGRIFSAGLSYRIDHSAPVGERVQDLRVQGEPIDPDRVYSVGAPSLLGFAESGYTAVQDVQIVERYGPGFVREVFEEALRQGLASERLTGS
jgi:5'-nucleotidase